MVSFNVFALLLSLSFQKFWCGHSHAAVTHINGVEGGSRNWLAHKLKRGVMREYDPYSMNGFEGRVDKTDYPCGELQDVGWFNRFSSVKGYFPSLQNANSCGDPSVALGKGISEDCYQYDGVLKTPIELGDQEWAVGTYNPGETIKLRIDTNAQHGGFYETRYVCADNIVGRTKLHMTDFFDHVPKITSKSECLSSFTTPTRPISSAMWRDGKCWNPRVLKRTQTSITSTDRETNYMEDFPQWYIIAMSSDSSCFANNLGAPQKPTVDVEYDLPSSLGSCKEVIVQWWWQTSNNCLPPEWLQAENGKFPSKCPNWPSAALGWNDDKSKRNMASMCRPFNDDKATSGEQFANCVNLKLSQTAPENGNPTDPPLNPVQPSTTSNPLTPARDLISSSPRESSASSSQALTTADKDDIDGNGACTGCYGGTSGPCKGRDTACWDYQNVHGKLQCPLNTVECSTSRGTTSFASRGTTSFASRGITSFAATTTNLRVPGDTVLTTPKSFAGMSDKVSIIAVVFQILAVALRF